MSSQTIIDYHAPFDRGLKTIINFAIKGKTELGLGFVRTT